MQQTTKRRIQLNLTNHRCLCGRMDNLSHPKLDVDNDGCKTSCTFQNAGPAQVHWVEGAVFIFLGEQKVDDKSLFPGTFHDKLLHGLCASIFYFSTEEGTDTILEMVASLKIFFPPLKVYHLAPPLRIGQDRNRCAGDSTQ